MRQFHLVLIKPSHYDDDGYVIQFWRSSMPANTLAVVQGLAQDCNDRKVLGEDVEIVIHPFDETNRRIRPDKIASLITDGGGSGLVGLVGVQSNQFPRAMDLARRFRELGIDVCIGGFHVSGTLAMLPETPPELTEAMSLGISLFAGEGEHHFDAFMRDAFKGELKPLYDFMDDQPDLTDVPAPILPPETVRRTAGGQTSFDAGRGCPFECSFCTIINVQGRTSRYRSGPDVAQIVRANLDQGIKRFFITDDNFARNRNWEEILDHLAELRESQPKHFNIVIQVDTLCHKIPNFIDKCARAGVKRVFIGLENINPDSLKGAKKRQNRITEYRKMVQAWKDKQIFTVAGYILGFPNDTKQSILRDIEIIKRELPIDLLEFFYLTPLPGSEDHKVLVEKGAWLEPDLNKYDLCHVCAEHPLMSREEWQSAYAAAWAAYYSHEHAATLLKRARARNYQLGKIVGGIVAFLGSFKYERVHPLESGVLRLKFRKDRRPTLPVESAWVFYPKYLGSFVYKNFQLLRLLARYHLLRKKLERDPEAASYTDLSLTPVTDGEIDVLEIFNVTEAAQTAVVKETRRRRTSAR